MTPPGASSDPRDDCNRAQNAEDEGILDGEGSGGGDDDPTPPPEKGSGGVEPAGETRGEREWKIRLRALRVYLSAAAAASPGPPRSTEPSPPPPHTITLPNGGDTTAAELRGIAESALAFFDSSLGIHSLSAGVPPRLLTGDDDDSTLRSLGVNDRDVVTGTLFMTSEAAAASPPGLREARNRTESEQPETCSADLPPPPESAASLLAGPKSSTDRARPRTSKRAKKVGTFKGKKNRLGSSDDRLAVGVGGSGQVGGDTAGGDVPASRAAAAEAAVAAIAGGGTGEGLIGRQLTIEDIDGRVARRTALHAARQAVSTAAMLADPGPDGGDDDGGAQATRMAADLMRAAEASAARGSAADPTIASLQNAFQAVVQERAMEAEGNRKSVRRRRGLCDVPVARGWPSRGSILGARRRRGTRGTRRGEDRDRSGPPRGPSAAGPSRRGGGSESGGSPKSRARRDGGGVAAGVLGDCPARRRGRWGRDRFRGSAGKARTGRGGLGVHCGQGKAASGEVQRVRLPLRPDAETKEASRNRNTFEYIRTRVFTLKQAAKQST